MDSDMIRKLLAGMPAASPAEWQSKTPGSRLVRLVEAEAGA